jgi:hypothetical protein
MDNIDNIKKELFEIIEKYYYNYESYNYNIKEILIEHKNYIYLMKNLKICIIYKWINLKEDYKLIKSKIIRNDKLYYDIVKIYSNIIVYFDMNESKKIEKQINDIYCKKNNNIIELRELAIIHKEVYYAHNLLLVNKHTLLISVFSQKLNNIIDELLCNTKNLNKKRDSMLWIIKKIS